MFAFWQICLAVLCVFAAADRSDVLSVEVASSSQGILHGGRKKKRSHGKARSKSPDPTPSESEAPSDSTSPTNSIKPHRKKALMYNALHAFQKSAKPKPEEKHITNVWLAIAVVTSVGAWIVASFMAPSAEGEPAEKEGANVVKRMSQPDIPEMMSSTFETFSKVLDDNTNVTHANFFFLTFACPLQEARFNKSRAPDLMRSIRVFCVFVWLYALWCLSVSSHQRGHDDDTSCFIWNPGIWNWHSSAAVTFNCTAFSLMTLSVCMWIMTMRPEFVRAAKLDRYVASWLGMVLILSTVFQSRWHLSKYFGEDCDKIFLSHSSDERLSEVYFFIILFTCLFTPLRMKLAAPVCALAPVVYFILTQWLGTPCYDTPGMKRHICNDLKHENTGALFIMSFMCLMGVRGRERRTRASFLRMVKSFELVQEFVAEEAVDDGNTAMGRARQALKVAALGLGQLSQDKDLPPGLNTRMISIKQHLDVAVKSLKNVDKLFEVNADTVLGDDMAEDQALVDFINANMGGSGAGASHRASETAHKFAEGLMARHHASETGGKKSTAPRTIETGAGAAGDDGCSSMMGGGAYTSERPEEGEGETTDVQHAFVLAEGWGDEWGYDALELGRKTNNRACLYAGECALIDSGYGAVLNTRRSKMRAWVRGIHERYLPNAYHNEAHACQVTHFSKWIAQASGWEDKASEIQMCALMIASLGHDVGHIGRTNLFCMNAWHSFSLIWNDHAVLENMHAATCFSIMHGQAHIMENLDGHSMGQMRNCIVRFILATDIKEHHASLMKLKARMEEDSFMELPMANSSEDAWKKYEEDVIVGGETIIKSSDIGQGMMPWAQHKEWSYRVLCEFFEQGDEEKALGLTVSPLCERKGYNIVGGQAFFIDVLCKSLFTVLVRFADSNSEGKKSLIECLENGVANKESWKEEVANFYPETLTLDVIEQRFGKAETSAIYPYSLAQDMVCTKPLSVKENLNGIAQYQNSIFADDGAAKGPMTKVESGVSKETA